MDDALDIDDFTNQLCEACTRAAEVRMPYVHVALAIPFRCQFEWFDEAGDPRVVYLPTRAWVRPVEYQPPDLGDHAAQAKFMLHVEGGVPDDEFCDQLARELYGKAVQWAQAIYGEDGAPHRERDPLPVVFEPVIEHALGIDAGR